MMLICFIYCLYINVLIIYVDYNIYYMFNA